jgi:hypothetical protein
MTDWPAGPPLDGDTAPQIGVDGVADSGDAPIGNGAAEAQGGGLGEVFMVAVFTIGALDGITILTMAMTTTGDPTLSKTGTTAAIPRATTPHVA